MSFGINTIAGSLPLLRFAMDAVILIPASRYTVQVSDINARLLAASVVYSANPVFLAVHLWFAIEDETGVFKCLAKLNDRICFAWFGPASGVRYPLFQLVEIRTRIGKPELAIFIQPQSVLAVRQFASSSKSVFPFFKRNGQICFFLCNICHFNYSLCRFSQAIKELAYKVVHCIIRY
ncbi:hypothetical protein DOJ70_23475 [Salmonella enterica subsp. enterica]|nr:hypothetical protein [Salmonella enterica subsp. enterica serovar Newport]